MHNHDKISDFSSKHAASVLASITNDENRNIFFSFLSFLSELDTVSVKLLSEIYKLNSEYKNIVQTLLTYALCKYIGASREYIKLNSVIQNYILRNKFPIPKDIEMFLSTSIQEFSENINDATYTDNFDFSDLSYYIRETLKQNPSNVPEKFLYSTIYLKTIIELYNDSQIEKVISLIEKIKSSEFYMSYDTEIQNHIQYYYCMALTRSFSDTFDVEVNYFRTPEGYINYNFLKGFNYRINGELVKAENSFNNVLQKNPYHRLANRELVTVYRLMDMYDTAFSLAAANYHSDPLNLFQIQAYFECLIRQKNLTSEQNADLLEMLQTIENLKKSKNFEIYYQLYALYARYIEKDTPKAIVHIPRNLRIRSRRTERHST